jgi:hypothetical protein
LKITAAVLPEPHHALEVETIDLADPKRVECKLGTPFYCRKMRIDRMLDGTTRLSCNRQPIYHFSNISSFADYLVVTERGCVKVSDDLPLDVACLIGRDLAPWRRVPAEELGPRIRVDERLEVRQFLETRTGRSLWVDVVRPADLLPSDFSLTGI